MHVADQVIQIFAVVHGFLDDIDTDDIQRFERELLEFIVNTRAPVRDELIEKLVLDEALENKLKDAIAAFKRTFAPSDVLARSTEETEPEAPPDEPEQQAESAPPGASAMASHGGDTARST